MSCFYNGNVVCDLVESPDGWGWHGYLGVAGEHPLYGSLFYSSKRGLAIYHVVHVTGNSNVDDRWWFCFEGSRALQTSTYEELLDVSDELNKILEEEYSMAPDTVRS